MSKNARGRSIPVVTNKPKNRKGGKKKSAKGARWHFGVDKFSAGPVEVSGFSMGSGPRSLAQGPSSTVRTNAEPSHIRKSDIHQRREQIGIVNGSVGYSVTEYPINPGNTTLFPWLSQLAPLYERYKIHNLDIQFVPTGSGFAAPNVSGRLVLAADYDVMSPALASLQEAEGKDPNVPLQPYEEGVLRLDPAELTREPKFNRPANFYPPGGDPKTYDAGKVAVCVQGTPNTSQIGILYAVYTVELITPQLPQINDFVQDYHLAQYFVPPTLSLPNGVNTTLTLSRIPAPNGGGLNLTFDAATYTFTLTPGVYAMGGTFIASMGAGVYTMGGLASSLVTSPGGTILLGYTRNSATTFSDLTVSFTRYLAVTSVTTMTIIVSAYTTGAAATMGGTSNFWIRY